MFGKTREPGDHAGIADAASIHNEILGDETAATQAAELDELQLRLSCVEDQLHSQFTSMAAYAQIAQEQVELARAEARAENEHVEHRLTGLIERERSDRLRGSGGATLDERLDTLECAVAELHRGLDECLARQKALADAITALFESATPQPGTSPTPPAPPTPPTSPTPATPLAPPARWAPPPPPLTPPVTTTGTEAGDDGPIPGLSLR